MKKLICQECDKTTVHQKVTPMCYQCTKCGNKIVGHFVTPIDFGQKSMRRIGFWLEKYDAPDAHTTSARVMKALKERQELLAEVKALKEQQKGT